MCGTVLLNIALALWGPTAAPGSPSEDLADRVRALVVQLGDAKLDNRQAAEQALVELGPEALPHLPEINARTPAEVRERLTRIRPRLEREQLASSVHGSRVTLQGEMSLAAALEAIQHQTGNRLVGFEGRPGTVRVDWDNTLFWQALDEVLDQAELDINPFGGQPQTLVLSARTGSALSRGRRAVYRDAFRFEPLRVEARRDLRTSEQNTLRVSVQVTWEPRLTPISLRQPLEQLEAADENGLSLVRRESAAVLNVPIESGLSAVELGLPLRLPDRRVQRIAQLSCRLEAVVPGRMERFEFPNLTAADNSLQQKGGVRVTLERWRKNLDVYEARVRVRYDNPGGALESHRGWIYRNQAYLVRPDGQRVDNVGVQLTHQQPAEIGVAYLFDLEEAPEAVGFVYETPAVIEHLPLSYTFVEIPLP